MINVDELLNMNDKDFDEMLNNMSFTELQKLYGILYKEFNKSVKDFIKNLKENNHE